VNYLLDTNTCIAAMRNHPHVVRRLVSLSPGDCAISTITVYELLTGVAKCSDPVRELAKVNHLMQVIGELTFDATAAAEAAAIRARLEAQGQTIGPYDLLLAGQARSLQLTLVTHNTREFSRVVGLVIENWESLVP
jgi:tRNA(fMet)-specific endonuclease VapC